MLVPPRLLFSGLIDDASAFPPRNATIASALADHLIWRRSPSRDLIGPLLCPASRTEELSIALPVDEAVDVCLVVDGGIEVLLNALTLIKDDPRLVLVSVEGDHARLSDDLADVGRVLAQLPQVTAALEVPRSDFEECLALIQSGSWQIAKYRTGGATPEAFPTEGELASFLITCVTSGVPFKLTAGLHHAARNYDQRRGFHQHGLLNVLLATDAAAADEPAEAVVGLLAQRRSEVLTGRLKHWDEQRAADVRAFFRSFGCCEPAEPVAELKALGIVQDWA